MADIIEVVSADEMDNETLCRHLEARHAEAIDIEKNGSLLRHPDKADAWVLPYRAFHDRLHDIALPGALDHEHLF